MQSLEHDVGIGLRQLVECFKLDLSLIQLKVLVHLEIAKDWSGIGHSRQFSVGPVQYHMGGPTMLVTQRTQIARNDFKLRMNGRTRRGG